MRILQLTNYPTVNPLHGGQIRCYQIAQKLRRSGHEVHSLAIYIPDHYNDIGPEDIAIDVTSEFWKNDPVDLSDYYTGLYAEKHPDVLARLQKKVSEFSPEIIISEHPWLFNVAKAIKTG